MSSAANVVILLITLLRFNVFSYKILVFFPIHIKSHFDVFQPLFISLSERGHEVTVVSHFPRNITLTEYSLYTDISLNGTTSILKDAVDINEISGARYEKYFGITHLAKFAQTLCESSLSSTVITKILKSNLQFDVILTELFNTNCAFAVLKNWSAPLIGLSSCAIMPWTNLQFGNPDNPAYIPNIFLDNANDMSFLQRVENSLMWILANTYKKHVLNEIGNYIATKYMGESSMNLEHYAHKTNLLLVNTHFTLHGSRPLVPNIIEVGGLHIKGQNKLPEKLENWIQNATDGVIYFSMGSMIKGHSFPEEKRNIFLKVFARMKQRVLWKWENDTMPEKSNNIMIEKWMPQFDILCHPNIKVFISHGGLLSVTEAVHCGVPMIIMPQYGDQHTNAKAVETNGGGMILQYWNLTEKNVYTTLATVLDPRFKTQVELLSERFRDRPLKPLDAAIYWVEYVARHKGAPYMQSAATKLHWYQLFLLDVIAFLALVLLLISSLFYYLIKCICVILGKTRKEKLN